MKVKVSEIGVCQRSLEIEVEADKVSDTYKSMLNQYMKNASLPGFRKGKAPQAMVEKRYSKDLLDDVKQELVADAYREAVKQEELEVVAVMGMDEEEFDPKSEFRFIVKVDVPPEFKLPGYEGIKLKGENTVPEKKDIDVAIERLLDRYASYEDVEDRAVQEDDMVKIDYSAVIGEKPLEEFSPKAKGLGGKENYWVLVNDNAFLPEMKDGLTGCRIGDEKVIEVLFNDGFTVRELAGQEARFTVKVKAICSKVMPELTKDMLKRFNVDSEDELRAEIKDELEEAASRHETDRLQNEICAYLLKKTKIEVPKSQIYSITDDMIRRIVYKHTSSGGSREDIEAQKDEIFAEAKARAVDQVKLSYIMAAIAKTEKIEVSDAEVEEHVDKESESLGMPKEDWTDNYLDKIRAHLKTEKVLDMLLEKSIVNV